MSENTPEGFCDVNLARIPVIGLILEMRVSLKLNCKLNHYIISYDMILFDNIGQYIMVFTVDLLHKKDDEIKKVCDHKNQLMIELLEVYDMTDRSKVMFLSKKIILTSNESAKLPEIRLQCDFECITSKQFFCLIWVLVYNKESLLFHVYL
jgi:hypothetical protein